MTMKHAMFIFLELRRICLIVLNQIVELNLIHQLKNVLRKSWLLLTNQSARIYS